MAGINDLLAEQLGKLVPVPGTPVLSVSEQKKAAVTAAAESKKTRMAGYRSGAEMEVGLGDPNIDREMMRIGGAPTPRQAQDWVQGREDYMRDAGGARSAEEELKDFTIGGVNGVIQSVLGLGGAVAGGVDYLAGTDMAGSFNEASEVYNRSAVDSSSRTLEGHQRAKAARDELTKAENRRLEAVDRINGDSELLAGMKRVGRDFVSEFKNSNDVLDANTLATGMGSLLIAGPLSKAAKALKLGRAATPVAIGALEGGGAYQQTSAEIRNMSDGQLRASSPEYVRMVDIEGIDPDIAKSRIANEAGLIAAGIQAPIGAATGVLVSKFEGNPLARQSIKSMVGNILREGVEETAQGMSGTAVGNYAIGREADINRKLADNVGTAGAQSLKAGVGTAALIQAPGVAPALGRAAFDNVVKPVAGKISAKAKAINDSYGSDAPTSTLNMGANVKALQEKFNVPDVREFLKSHLASKVGGSQQVENSRGETVEINATNIGDYVERIHERMSIDPVTEAEQESSPVIKDAISQSTNRFDVLSRVSAIAADEGASPEDRRDAQIYLLSQLNKNNELLDSDVAQAIDLAPDDESDTTLQELRVYEKALNNMKANPEVKAAIEAAQKAAQGITAEEANDPATAVAAAKFAEIAPETAKLDVVNRVLLHAEKGTAPIPDSTRQSLEATRAVLEAAAEHDADNAAIKESGAKVDKNPNIVSQSVRRRGDDRESGMFSGRDYQTKILAAWRVGNKAEAGKQLGNLRKFAEHLSNKVGALNESLAKGNGIQKDSSVKYRSLNNRTKTFGTSMKGLYINPEIDSHVAFAQQVESDAKAIANLSNKFSEIFRELGVEPIEMTSLAPELKGNPVKIAAKFGAEKWGETRRQGKPAPYAKPTTGPAANAAPTQREAEDAPEAETKPETVDKPVSKIARKIPDTRSGYAAYLNDILSKVGKGLLETRPAYPDNLATPLDKGIYRFAYRGENNVMVSGKYTVEGDLLADVDIGDKSDIKDLGNGGTRALIRALANQHPEVKYFQMARSKTAGKIDREIWATRQEDGSLKTSSTDPRIAEEARAEAALDVDPATNADERGETDQPVERARRMVTWHGITVDESQFDDVKPGKMKVVEADEDGSMGTMTHEIYAKTQGGKRIFISYQYTGGKQDIADAVMTSDGGPMSLKGAALKFFADKVIKMHPEATGVWAQRISGALNQNRPSEPNYVAYRIIDGKLSTKGYGTNTKPTDGEKPVDAKSDPVAEIAPVAAEPVQVDEAVEPTGEPDEQAQPVDTSTVKGFFNKLFTDGGRVVNYFLESYVFRNEGSRLVGDPDPVKTMFETLRGHAAWVAKAGENASGDLTPELSRAYSKYLGNRGRRLKEKLEARLAAEMKKTRKGTNFAAMLKDPGLEGRSPMTFNNGKVLNLVEENEDGSMSYNKQLMDGAILAALQWAITAQERTSYRDRKAVARLLGISEDLVEQSDINFFNNGIPTVFAKRQLRDVIIKFWGVKAAKGARQGYVDGIAEAMAAELLASMDTYEDGTGAGLFTQAKAKVRDREYIQLVMSEAPDIDALQDLDNAIEQAVLINPEPTFRLEAENSNRPNNQLRNRQARLTKGQKSMVERESVVPHKINTPMVDFYDALKDLFVPLFGGGTIVEGVTNVAHIESIEGKNRTVDGARKTLEKLVRAAKNKSDIEKVEVFYDYEISAVGRLQQQGPNNPQSSKVMREAVLSTIQEVDLTNPKMLTLFKLAMSQHWDLSGKGKKPDQATHEVVAADVDRISTSETFAPMIKMLTQWEKNRVPFTEADVQLMQAAFNNDVTPAKVHAALEYARYINAVEDGADLSKFKTSTYIEADGKTDGPINAMMHMVSGFFSENWVEIMEKGGFFIGNRSVLEAGTPMTLNDFVTQGGERYTDLYGTAANITAEQMLATGKSTNAVTKSHMRDLLRLMQETGVGVGISADGNSIEISRNAVKNPITITIYGSGDRGIAGNIVTAIFDQIHADLSEGKVLSPAASKAFIALTEKKVAYNKQGRPFMADMDKGNGFYPDDLSSNSVIRLTRKQKRNLTENVLQLFVLGPLKAGITATTGETTHNVGLLRQAIQVQSIFIARQFNEKVHAKLAELDAATDGLTAEETQEIWDSLKHLNPLIDTGLQTFTVAAMGKADLRDMAKVQEIEADNRRERMRASGLGLEPDEGKLRKLPNPVDFGRTLDDKFRTPSEMSAPRNSGVRGIPMMIIGPGDGLMIQNFSADPSRPNSLLVFDGINLGLNDFTDGSEAANRAVGKGWFETNPLADVAQSYRDFFAEVDMSNIDETLHIELNDALEGLHADLIPIEELIEKMTSLGPDLDKAALGIQARKNVLKKVGWSIDHMATGMAPHSQTGSIKLEGDTPAEVAASLNVLLKEELARLQSEEADLKTKPVSENILKDLNSVGELNAASGARTMGLRELRSAVRKMSIPKGQKDLIEATLRALGSSDLQITFGTLEQIIADRAANNLEPLDTSKLNENSVVHGMHVGHEGQVYLISPSSETLLHELIHAATLGHLDSYYSRNKEGLSSEQIDAIERLQALMWQVLRMQDNEIPYAAKVAYREMRIQVEALMEKDPAGALNEFMTWSLSNQDLVTFGKTKKVGVLAQIAADVIAALKSLIWGRAKAPEVGNDIYSNIRFNTLVLMNSLPSNEQRIMRSIEFHRTSTGATNSDTLRMQAIHEGLYERMAAYVESYPETDREVETARIGAAIDISYDISQAFINYGGWSMDPQRHMVFETVVMALATEMELDGNAMARMQQLYAGIIGKLTEEDFMVDPVNGGFADRDQAQKKLSALLGTFTTRKDLKNRSTLLPSFVALAVTNDQFRDVLRKIDLPKSLKDDAGTVDAMLENFGVAAMDRLMKLSSGEGRGSVNVLQAVDALTNVISRSLAKEEGLIQQGWTKSGTFVDIANDKVKGALKSFSDRSNRILQGVVDNTTNRGVKLGANVIKAITDLASEERTDVMKEGINKALNTNSTIPEFLKNVYVEVVGRTQSNALIFDMIKKVRSYVQQTRQEFREQLPKTLAKMFSRVLTAEEYSQMTKGLAKTDIAVLAAAVGVEEAISMLINPASIDARISQLEASIQGMDPANWALRQTKAKELAEFMNGAPAGKNLLRNAHAVSHLYLEIPNGIRARGAPITDAMIKDMDQLVSLYALKGLEQSTKDTLKLLAENEADGLNATISYLIGQRVDEMAKVNGSDRAIVNHYKGHVPFENDAGSQLIVADDSEAPKLERLGFTRVADYKGSRSERNQVSRGYYYTPVRGRAAFKQGIMQQVRKSAYGVDPFTGYTMDSTVASVIENPNEVAQITRLQRVNGQNGGEALLPVLNLAGDVVAYERSIKPSEHARLKINDHMGEILGIWRGRLAEEHYAEGFNRQLVQNLATIWNRDKSTESAQFIDLLGPEAARDPIYRDAVSLITRDGRDMIKSAFPDGKFMVRRDLVNDSIGYRSVSIGDSWTGISRMDPEVQRLVRDVSMSILGKDAFRKLITAEAGLQRFVTDAKVTIVVKSIVVPAFNIMSNIVQGMARGVPIEAMRKGYPRKAAEVDAFLKGRLERQRLGVLKRIAEANGDQQGLLKAELEIQAILDANRRLSIWPLLEAGELNSISDTGVSHEDVLLSEGKFAEYFDQLTDRLPDKMKTAAKYGMITRDTALFKGLQKAVQYGDFLAKAVLFDHLTINKKMSQQEALATIGEEYVNYDRNAGRQRGYLEDIGVFWFWNFKIRSLKVAASTLRNNPVHAALTMLLPLPSGIGSPLTDNILAVAVGGNMGYSVGWDQLLHAHSLNPFWNMAT